MKKYKDMGYETYREEPLHKDFNEDLKFYVKQMEEIEQTQVMGEAEVEM